MTNIPRGMPVPPGMARPGGQIGVGTATSTSNGFLPGNGSNAARLPNPGTADSNPVSDYLMGRGGSFNSYGAGNKQYGIRGAPNVGPVADRSGYMQRDQNAQRLRNAALRRLQANQRGNFGSPESLRGM